jgi:hypothetical protein
MKETLDEVRRYYCYFFENFSKIELKTRTALLDLI